MTDNHKCKELQEAVECLAELGGFIAKRASDDVGVDDRFALAKNFLKG